ncbi:MAG: DNA mismatch repair protein MutS [Hyphomicrobiales bacterium]
MNERATQAGIEAAQATPMMAQYLEIKAANPGSLLFYRMGDFYEMFFEDAEIASRALGIALTKRGKHLGEDIPMCGVPVHAATDYLNRLIRLGHRIAICEQTEDPAEAKKRGSKSVVRRAIVRLVTAGTLTEETLLPAKANNYLVSIARVRSEASVAVAWVDISTGDFAVTATSDERLSGELARLEPSEIIVADSLSMEASISRALETCGATVTALPASRFDSTSGEDRLRQHFAVAALEGFGSFSRAEIAAAGALVDYVLLTQVGRLPHLSPPRRVDDGRHMLIDQATRANLELTRTLQGERRGSLLDAVDQTVTAAGSRLLAQRLSSPLTDPAAIAVRLDAVDVFAADPDLRRDVRQRLARTPDLERALTRLTVGRGGPRDLMSIAAGTMAAADLGAVLRAASDRSGLAQLPSEVDSACASLSADRATLVRALTDALADTLPLDQRDGNFVRHGFDAALDQQRALRDESRRVIAGLESNYADLAGVKALKIKHNNVLGYFIEVSQQHGEKLLQRPLSETFIHRQTMANAMRFSTAELGDLEQRILLAGERSLAIELAVFDRLVRLVTNAAADLLAVARALAALDVAAAAAEIAVNRRWCRPIVDGSRMLKILEGRHPVVEEVLRRDGASAFVPNDCDLSAEDGGRHIWLLTGPNMAGKSTFLRQNALITVLAQTGLPVPAKEAHIGVSDRLFSRVGAADDLARGRSTFMVEMVETAAILNQATDRSLVILDEIGRGTATFDGLSIAWAAVEHLHEVNRSRALFATHFHELTALAQRLPRLANATVKVKEWQGDVVFLHEVGPGAADRSYGIQVAKLAGLPPSVIARAAQVLEALESNERSRPKQALVDDLPLFTAARAAEQGPSPNDPATESIVSCIAAVNADELTPREALSLVYELKLLANCKQ